MQEMFDDFGKMLVILALIVAAIAGGIGFLLGRI